jgi:hypothetical protein
MAAKANAALEPADALVAASAPRPAQAASAVARERAPEPAAERGTQLGLFS